LFSGKIKNDKFATLILDMATKKKEKEEKKLLENPDVLADKLDSAEDFLLNNRKLLSIIFGVLVVVAGGWFYYNYYQNSKNEEAEKDMFQAVYYFEADSLDKALNGDGNILGFVQIADEYGVSKVGNLANYYAGIIYLRKGEFDKAIESLKKFDSSDWFVQARTYSLIGDAYMEKADFSKASEYYNKAANYKPNKFFTPQYLMKEALASEKNNNVDAAIKAYDKILNDYSTSSEYTEARKNRSRLNAVANK
jgi:tetratricopeptide (TPR) repeat protein